MVLEIEKIFRLRSRVRRFRLKFFFASKRNEAKQDPFRFVFACSSKNKSPIFSLVFASFRFEFFASKRKEKHFCFEAKRKHFFRFVYFCQSFFASFFAVTNSHKSNLISITDFYAYIFVMKECVRNGVLALQQNYASRAFPSQHFSQTSKKTSV
jgi:hypothetical protein